MKLIIDRARWDRGNRSEPNEIISTKYHQKWKLDFISSVLLDSETGKMCCLGFCAVQCCGATDEEILDKLYPRTTPDVKWIKGLIDDGSEGNLSWNSSITNALINLNDAKIGYCFTYHNISHPYDHLEMRIDSEEARENFIKIMFAKLDIEVEFIN